MKKLFNIKGLRDFKVDARVFALILLGLILFYNFQETCLLRPQGLHQWRQSVGASYAMNYYNYDLDITQLRIYNHISQWGDSDYSIADFPIFYYLIGILYSIFGNTDSIYRITNALLLLVGLYYLMLSTRMVIKDSFWSFFIPVILFTSPTLVYYSNGFLPDTTAFALALIAIYYVLKYYFSGKVRYVYISSVLYALAGLIKVTSLMSLLAISGAVVLMFIFSKKRRAQINIFELIVPIFFPIVSVILWQVIVSKINSQIGGTISDVHLRAIWDMEAVDVTKTWDGIYNHWLNSYFHYSVQLTALIMFILSLVFYKKSDKFLNLTTGLTLFGSAFFFFAFFRSLLHHDYDLINVFILIVFGLAVGLILLKNVFPKIFSSYILKLLATIWIVFLSIECKEDVHSKFHGYINYAHKNYYYGLEDIEKYNRSIGISPNDLVISIRDVSINITLYLMNQPGFTDFGFNNLTGAERIDFFIDKNAKYLIINDTSIYRKSQFEYIQPYLKNRIGQHRNIDIFSLQDL